jgi:hypothetical protein
MSVVAWVLSGAPSVWWLAGFVAVELSIAAGAVAAVWGDR